MKLDTHALVERVAPSLQTALESRRDQIITGGPIQRAIEHALWPRLLAALPLLAEAAIDAVVDEFGHLTLEDVLASLAQLRAEKAARQGNPQ